MHSRILTNITYSKSNILIILPIHSPHGKKKKKFAVEDYIAYRNKYQSFFKVIKMLLEEKKEILDSKAVRKYKS